MWHALVTLSGVYGRCDFVRWNGGSRATGGGAGLQLKTNKCTFMQTEVFFLGHIVGRTGLACDPATLSAVRNWHAPDKVKGV